MAESPVAFQLSDPPGPDDVTPAGPFGAWLAGMAAALRGEAEAGVPCGTCTACCRSSQFVHIEPDETATLARIPAALRFPAPGLPAGHVLMGYDEHGRCPMLSAAGCSIYADRPCTCRVYDCRVFPAASVEPDGHQPLLAARVRRWRFDHPADADASAHDAVCAAAVRIRGSDRPPATATQLAVSAVAAALTDVGD